MAWNRPTSNTGNATSSSRPSGRGKMPRLRRGLIAGAIVVLGAGLAAWLLTNGEATSSSLQKKDRGLIKEVTPAVPRPKENAAVKPKPEVEPGPAKDNRYGGIWRGKRIMQYSVKTNGTSIYEHIVTEDGKKHGIIDSTVKPIYECASDQMIAFALMHDGIHEMPPMPISASLDEEFRLSLKKPLRINENDTPEVKRMKEDIMAVRENLRQQMENGLTFHEALEQHFKEQNENVRIRQNAVEDVRKILATGDRENAEQYVEIVNKSLEKLGAMPIELPGVQKKERHSQIPKTNNPPEEK